MKKFKKIFVEITNCCNLSCSFCQRTQRHPAFITPEEFESTLAGIAGWTDHISLHLLGEPLLHPDLSLLLEKCHRYRLQVNLTTNATLLARQRHTLLTSPALRQINFSLHSCEERESRTYLDTILDFTRDAQQRTPLFLNLRLWNLSTMPAEGLNRTIHRRLEEFFALPAPVPASLTPGQGIKLAERVFLSQEEEFTWPHAPAPDLGERGTCLALRDHIGILVDGTVVPCCLDAEGDIPLGNLRHTSLAAILATPRAMQMRQGFMEQRLHEPLCRRCTYRRRFDPPPPKSSGS